jgi:hypothetical protein
MKIKAGRRLTQINADFDQSVRSVFPDLRSSAAEMKWN